MSRSALPNILGVDFGTSNSALGVMKDGKPHLVEIEDGEDTLPTSIFFDSEERIVRYGRSANTSLIERHEGRFMRALKSVLGTPLMHEPRYLLGKSVTFVDIIAHFLCEIKSRAEAKLDSGFDYALSGRPVHFHSENGKRDAQALKDLTQCYLAAGFRGVEFLYEPEAAAIANGGFGGDEVALIVDIGGGTSDFCLFRKGPSKIDVLASSGIRVGGTNFDKTLSIDHVMPLLGYGQDIGKEMGEGTLAAPKTIFQDLATWERIPSLYSKGSREFADRLHKLAINKTPFSRLQTVLDIELGHDIAFSSERAKIEANKIGDAAIDLAFLEDNLSVPLSHSLLEHSLKHHAERIRACALDTLALADFPAEKVNQVIFVGGSSLMNVVETTLSPSFPNAELHYSDAFTAIVDGLTIASEDYA